MDQYQKRYLAHQKRKKEQLIKAMRERYSCRIFSDKALTQKELDRILDHIDNAPSSCDRRAVELKPVRFRTNKELIGGILVGGVGWIHRADTIFLLVANKSAYKEGLDYMPYLDAGFLANYVWLACTMEGIGCCFVNPNVREENQDILGRYLLPNELFCGALAIGYIE